MRLTKETNQFEALFYHASIGIVVTNQEGKIVNFNKYAEEQFGYSREEVMGQPVELLVPQSRHHAHLQHRKNFYQHPSPRTMGAGRDLFAVKKDGTKFPVEVSLSYYKISKETFVISFVIDITVRKTSEQLVINQKEALEKVTSEILKLNVDLEEKVEYRTQMLRETLAELEKSKDVLSNSLVREKELNELKSRFVTSASHEFRTPLSTILSSTYLLEKYNAGDKTESRTKHIERIKYAVQEMKAILEDFLSLGKLEEGLVELKLEILTKDQLRQIMENVLAEMELIKKREQSFQFHFQLEGPVKTDPHLVKQVLINLISNAIKFSPDKGKISLECKQSEKEFLFSVKDEGIGISEEDQKNLFTRFFRAKNALNIQGTGLGLHIISKYLELLHGNVSIKTALHEGSVFTVYIPK